MFNNDNESKYVPDKQEPETFNPVTPIETSYSNDNITDKIEVSKEINPIPWSHDNKAVSIMKNWYPLRFKLNYPKNSVLSAYEQKDYLNLHSKFRNRTHVNEKEVKFYKLYSVTFGV